MALQERYNNENILSTNLSNGVKINESNEENTSGLIAAGPGFDLKEIINSVKSKIKKSRRDSLTGSPYYEELSLTAEGVVFDKDGKWIEEDENE